MGCMAATTVSSTFGFPFEFPAAVTPFFAAVLGLSVLDGPARLERGRQPVLTVGLLLLILGVGVVWQHVKFDHYALNQRVASAREDWPDVVESGERALAFGSLDEKILLLNGRAFAEMGDTDLAMMAYKDGLRQNPNHFGLWVGLGESLRQKGQTAEAFESFSKALRLNPRSGEALNNIGVLHAASGQLDSAAVYLESAAIYWPKHFDVYANLGILYRKLGRFDDAYEASSRAVAIEPGRTEGHHGLGLVQLATGHPDDAALSFRRCLDIDPKLSLAYFHLARSLEQAGQAEQAADAYEAYLGRPEMGPPSLREIAEKKLVKLRLRALETESADG